MSSCSGWPRRQPVLEAGPHVHLRPFTVDDVEAVYLAHQDPDMVRFLPVVEAYTRAKAERFALGVAAEMWAEESGCAFALAESRTGTLLGSVGVPHIDYAAGQATVGYWVAPHGRGRGAATAGLRALSEWLFTHIGLTSVLLVIEDANTASAAVARKAGYERQDGEVTHEVLGRPLAFTQWVRYHPVEPQAWVDPEWLGEVPDVASKPARRRPVPLPRRSVEASTR